MSHRICEELYNLLCNIMTKKVKNISNETQLVDGEEIKAWAVFETVHWESIIRNYPNLYELVDESKEEKKEEKVEEKPAKKSKK